MRAEKFREAAHAAIDNVCDEAETLDSRTLKDWLKCVKNVIEEEDSGTDDD